MDQELPFSKFLVLTPLMDQIREMIRADLNRQMSEYIDFIDERDRYWKEGRYSPGQISTADI